MKMKTILSVCMLASLLYACTKSDKGPLDCSGIENGTAITDDCGDCHKWMIYNYVTHEVTEIDDTTNALLGATEMFTSPNNPMNPAWNFCPDCNGISNGIAALDSCDVCHQSYIYNFVTHIPTYIVDTTGLSLDPSTQMLILAGSPQDIASNPNWNNCK
jgi:hypothetical protein